MTTDFYCDEVLSGKTQVNRVFETAEILAFHHTRPSYPVHIVIIPKQHITSLLELDADSPLLANLMFAIQTVARQVLDQYSACRVITNLGSYQDSKHLHWHIISNAER